MKKPLFYLAVVSVTFFAACTDSATESNTEKKTSSSTTLNEPEAKTTTTTVVQPAARDTVKRTVVSVGSAGTNVKHKNTELKVDAKGVKVGTKDVDFEINK
jgi:ABC-type Fe3+-hydroxamate transport system substrate-binding protein